VTLEFRAGRSDRSPGRELLAELNALLDTQYPGRSARPGSVTTPEEMAPPRGRFLVGYDDGEAVAIGGVRPLGPDVAEIKRMYVAPAYRRQGLARVLLAHIEDSARDAGRTRIWLETGMNQPEAMELYRTAGYDPIDGYGHYKDAPLARPMGKSLG
jgi:GNAT superfamily N-acetyltransferase